MCLSQLLLFVVVGEGDGFTKMEMGEYVLLFHDLSQQHYREQQWRVENLLCLAAPAGVYRGWPCGRSPSSPASGYAGARGAARVRSESWAGKGSWRAAFSCVLCGRSAKNTGWESPLKALKSPMWSFWSVLSHPPFPKESTAKLKEWRASADHTDSCYTVHSWYQKKNPETIWSLVILTVRKELLC